VAQPCRSSISLGYTPPALQISALPGHAPRPATLEIQTLMISILLGHTRRPAQPCRSSVSLGHTHQPCTSLLFQPHPHRLHSPARSLLCWATHPRPCTIFTPQACAHKACQAGEPHTHWFWWTTPPKFVKPGIHRHTGSPLCRPAPFRHTKPMFQKPATSLS
jgi:hypothetical protein